MARKQKKYHYIYKTTCNVNGKYYIGMHSTDNLEYGYLGSGKRLWHSINYHGKDNHIKEILEFCEDREHLKKREEEIVNKQLINEDLCMNLKTGGQGGFVDVNHYEKFKSACKSNGSYHKHKLETDSKYRIWWINLMNNNRPDFSNENNGFYGKVHSEETKIKIGEVNSKKQKGKKNSQYGTCWVTRDGENKKVKKEDLQTHINIGWVKGRKIK